MNFHLIIFVCGIMNFNLVERNESEEFIQKFIELYYDRNYSIKDICRILDMSVGKYQRIRNELIEKSKIDKKFRSLPTVEESKYYIYDKRYNTFMITKTMNGRTIYFLSVPTEEKAKYCVSLFQKYGWNKKLVPFVKDKMYEKFK